MSNRATAPAVAVLLAAVMLGACSGVPDPGPTVAGTPTPVVTPTPAPTATSPTSDSATSAATEGPLGVVGRADGVLRIGTVLPMTGLLEMLAAPQLAGVELAVADVNAAGGVLGSPVELLLGDSMTDAATARAAVTAHVAAGVDAIIGAASSTVTAGMLLTVSDAPAAHCAASATASTLTGGPDATRFVRTAPPDEAAGLAIGSLLARTAPAVDDDGAAVPLRVALVRSDAAGAIAMEAALREVLDAVPAGRRPRLVGRSVYAVAEGGRDGYGPQVKAVTALDPAPAVVVVLGYRELSGIVDALLGAGVAASSIVLPDAAFRPAFAEEVTRSVVGVRVVGPGGDEGFSERLDRAVSDAGEPGNLVYGAQAYDCVVTLALAAAAAGSDATADIVRTVPRVTSGGTACTSFAACMALLEDGEEIDYDGPSGGLAIDATGDPREVRYAVGSFTADGLRVTGAVDLTLDVPAEAVQQG